MTELKNGWKEVNDDKDDFIRKLIKYNQKGYTYGAAKAKFMSKNSDHFQSHEKENESSSSPRVKPPRGSSGAILSKINGLFISRPKIGDTQQQRHSHDLKIGGVQHSPMQKSIGTDEIPRHTPNRLDVAHTTRNGAGRSFRWGLKTKRWI